MKIKKIIEKNKFKVYLITLPELIEIEVQLDKDKEPEIISFDRFLLMTEIELNEKEEIEINSLQFLKMLEGTDIPVMIGFDKFTFGDFRISRENQEEMFYEFKMPDDKELEKIVLNEDIIKHMDTLLKSQSKGMIVNFKTDLKENELNKSLRNNCDINLYTDREKLMLPKKIKLQTSIETIIQKWINLEYHLNNTITSLRELSEKWDEIVGKGDWFSHEIDNFEKSIKAIEERHNKLYKTL